MFKNVYALSLCVINLWSKAVPWIISSIENQ